MYKSILYFAGGLILGGVAGFFLGKKATEKAANERADRDVEEMRRYYERKQSYSGGCRCRSGNERADDVDGVDQEAHNEGKHRTNYSSYYKPGSAKTDLVYEEGADPEADAEEEESEMERAVQEVEEEEYERQMNRNRRPKLISAEAVDELPPYVTMQVLYYFPETDVLIDEDDHMVGEAGEYGYLVGDCIEKYGFGDEDNMERIIFVRNFDLDACYEIQKMPGDDPITAAALEASE